MREEAERRTDSGKERAEAESDSDESIGDEMDEYVLSKEDFCVEAIEPKPPTKCDEIRLFLGRFAWVYFVAVVTFSSYLIILYGLRYGKQRSVNSSYFRVFSLDWLSTVSYAILQRQFIVEPIKSLAITVVLISIFKYKMQTEDRLDEVAEGNLIPADPEVFKEVADDDQRTLTYFRLSSEESHSDIGIALSEVSTLDHIYQYLETTFIEGLYPESTIDQEALDIKSGSDLTRDISSFLLGVPRLVQRRTNQDCRVPGVLEPLGLTCLPDLTSETEEKGSFEPGWLKYSQVEEEGRKNEAWKYREEKEGKGYIVDFGRKARATRGLIHHLKKHNWLNELTRSLELQGIVFNPNVNCYVMFNVHFRNTLYGIVQPFLELLSSFESFHAFLVTLNLALTQVAGYLLLFLTIVMAYTMLGMQLFYAKEEFSWGHADLSDLTLAGKIFYGTFSFIVVVLLVNLFISVLTMSFQVARDISRSRKVPGSDYNLKDGIRDRILSFLGREDESQLRKIEIPTLSSYMLISIRARLGASVRYLSNQDLNDLYWELFRWKRLGGPKPEWLSGGGKGDDRKKGKRKGKSAKKQETKRSGAHDDQRESPATSSQNEDSAVVTDDRRHDRLEHVDRKTHEEEEEGDEFQSTLKPSTSDRSKFTRGGKGSKDETPTTFNSTSYAEHPFEAMRRRVKQEFINWASPDVIQAYKANLITRKGSEEKRLRKALFKAFRAREKLDEFDKQMKELTDRKAWMRSPLSSVRLRSRMTMVTVSWGSLELSENPDARSAPNHERRVNSGLDSGVNRTSSAVNGTISAVSSERPDIIVY
ncbi:unnamed protein product [Cyprideis torosa]|uniref:Uncharacterized protein n=1 Tax=Cyprideis torosa TaxID=163714 RepID=A0A7R8ZSU2_9CRUS|nr:unnamed protein product [Cyprideis torosa]CAG0896371.1 unnamed protein product [Cyprideis torosa]